MNREQKNINKDLHTARLRITSKWNEVTDAILKQEIHDADEFEFYFGVSETPERLHMVTVNRELFYSIYEKESEKLVGYLGFTEDGDAWEPEIYIFKKYRGKGYGTEALNYAIKGLLSEELMIDKNGSSEAIKTECVRSTVRAENIASQKMMEKIGLKKNASIACCFEVLLNPEDTGDSSFFEIVEYSMTKNEFINLQN